MIYITNSVLKKAKIKHFKTISNRNTNYFILKKNDFELFLNFNNNHLAVIRFISLSR